MPARAPTPCRKPGCGALCRDGKGYCEAHRHTKREQAQNGKSRHERGYGWAWERVRKQVIQRDKGLCQLCLASGKVVAGNECDHITPKARGGSDDLSNLRLLCRPCHRSVTAREAMG